MVMAGEKVDSTERRQPGQWGLAPQTAAPVKEHPNELQRTLQVNTPRDAREGGGGWASQVDRPFGNDSSKCNIDYERSLYVRQGV